MPSIDQMTSIRPHILSYFGSYETPLNRRQPENNSLLKWKNIKELYNGWHNFRGCLESIGIICSFGVIFI